METKVHTYTHVSIKPTPQTTTLLQKTPKYEEKDFV